MDETELIANSIVKALGYAENGGAPNLSNLKKGKTGETKSIFQFTPSTWKQYAKETFGSDQVPMDPDSETQVVKTKVLKWIKQGKTARQMASMWNAGASEPDAYTGKFSDGSSSVGVNKKYGVKFDVPTYADKVLKYSKQFYSEGNKPVQDQSKTKTEAMNSVMDLIKKASTKNIPISDGQTSESKSGLLSQLSANPVT